LVRLTGGEPLLHTELDQLLTIVHRAGPATSVITNGWHLSEDAERLANVGLNQVIVSLDAPTAARHDLYRKTPGLFDRAVRGLAEFRRLGKTRVNTVAGPHNYRTLSAMYDLLSELEVDQWSIIPIKWPDRRLSYRDQDTVLEDYCSFQQHVAGADGPTLVGYSAQWMGRDADEVRSYLTGGRPFTPNSACGVVRLVRYMDTRERRVYPCNCVPHRVGSAEYGWGLGDAADRESHVMRWLEANGPQTCEGCEPSNAYLGEGRADLDADPYGF